MGRPATLAIRITADARRATQGAAQAQSAFDRLTGTIRGFAVAAAAGAGLDSLRQFATDAVQAASEVQQNYGALDAVFKKNASAVKAWSDGAAQSVGLSKREYSGLAVTLGATLKNLGVSQDSLGGTTNDLIKKAADLSSMFGGTTKEAVEALTSAFRGESDPIERYGISINETAVKAYQAAHASEKLTATQARMRLIYEQSTDAAGNFAKESNTLAGQQQRLAAQWDNVKAAIGERFLPVLTSAMSFLNATALPALKDFARWVADSAGAVARVTAAVAPYAAAVAAVAAVIAGPYIAAVVTANAQMLVYIARLGLQTAATKAAAVATKAWSAVQLILNAVLAANPITLVIAALVAIAAAVVIAYNKSETFRRIVDRCWSALKVFGALIGGAIMAALRALQTALGWVSDKVSALIRWLARLILPGALLLIKVGLLAIRQAAQWVSDKVSSLINWLGRFRLPSPLGAIKSALIGIRDAAGWVIGKIQSLISWLGKIPGAGALSKLVSAVSRAAPASAAPGARGALYDAPRDAQSRRAMNLLSPSVFITIDGEQLQGRITRTSATITRRALLAEGERLAAGGWA